MRFSFPLYLSVPGDFFKTRLRELVPPLAASITTKFEQRWLTVINLQESCTFDIIGSLNTKLFQIWSSVAGYGELCMCF